MKKLIFMAALGLVGCSQSEGQEVEAEYRIARGYGVNAAQACEFERRIEQAYLRDQDKGNYERWRLSADVSCNQAAIDRQM